MLAKSRQAAFSLSDLKADFLQTTPLRTLSPVNTGQMMALMLGPQWERDLWSSPYRLRFELSVGEAYVTMFTAAYDRARALSRAALSADDPIAVIAADPDPQREVGANAHGWTKGSGFDHLKELGVPTEDALATWIGYCWPGDEDDDEQEPWLHRAVKLTWDQVDILLWNQIAQDVGIAPRAPVKSKLVDLTKGLSVDAYDDRGMDITSLSKAPVAKLYNEFDEWLLDYDRVRMKEAFGD